jgi:L-ornithine N5-oxygenase
MTNKQSGADGAHASARDGHPNGATVSDGHGSAVNGHLNCRDGLGSAIHNTRDNASSNGYIREEEDEPYDLICVGFGPASLAIGIALYDRGIPARVLFLERQSQFAWHSGMLLPGTRMQISFMKDLATFRNPKSEFTFINYLHQKNRLAAFTNMGTFLPLREEYNDYMSWCASHFNDVVRYSQEVLSVTPVGPTTAPVRIWKVISRCTKTGKVVTTRTKNVVVAVGGQPSFPPAVAQNLPDPRIIHSSRYSDSVPNLLDDPTATYNIAIVGAGQSSAEIFNDLQSRYPNSKTALFIRQHALKPSDDSPFVNEIFDPDRVDTLYSLSPPVREASILEDRMTNYSVVRINLLEDLYHKDVPSEAQKSERDGMAASHISSTRGLWHRAECRGQDPAKHEGYPYRRNSGFSAGFRRRDIRNGIQQDYAS